MVRWLLLLPVVSFLLPVVRWFVVTSGGWWLLLLPVVTFTSGGSVVFFFFFFGWLKWVGFAWLIGGRWLLLMLKPKGVSFCGYFYGYF